MSTEPETTDASASDSPTPDLPVIDAGPLTLGEYPEGIAVVRFGPGTDIPSWAESSSVFAVIATGTETTVLCAARNVPAKARSRKPLIGFALEPGDDGPQGKSTGVLVTLLTPLAEAGIAVDVVTTYDTLWILVAKDEAKAAADALRRRGHTVAPARPQR